MRAIEKSVVYCLEVPSDQVIYFSSIKWDYVLNNLYIGKAQRTEKFEFSRTSSRLFEMQSEEYIKKWQQKYNRLL